MAKSSTMFIWDLLQRQDTFSFSYEVAPPKKDKQTKQPEKELPNNESTCSKA